MDMNTEAYSKSEKVTGDEKEEQLKTTKEKSDIKTKSETECECKPDVEKAETSTKKKETQVVVDKELLQARGFEFWDFLMFSVYVLLSNQKCFTHIHDSSDVEYMFFCFLTHQAFRFFDRNRLGYIRVNKYSLALSFCAVAL